MAGNVSKGGATLCSFAGRRSVGGFEKVVQTVRCGILLEKGGERITLSPAMAEFDWKHGNN